MLKTHYRPLTVNCQEIDIVGCAPTASLQIIDETTWRITEFVKMSGRLGASADNGHAMFELDLAELVVGICEHLKHGLEGFEAAIEAAAAARKARDIVPQIGIDALDVVGVAFVMNISHVPAGKNYIQVAVIPVRGVVFSPWRVIHETLQAKRTLIHLHIKAYDLPRLRADHRHHIAIFFCFSLRFLLDEPVYLVKLEGFREQFFTFQQFFSRFF